jgi:hypothetical protein
MVPGLSAMLKCRVLSYRPPSRLEVPGIMEVNTIRCAMCGVPKASSFGSGQECIRLNRLRICSRCFAFRYTVGSM